MAIPDAYDRLDHGWWSEPPQGDRCYRITTKWVQKGRQVDDDHRHTIPSFVFLIRPTFAMSSNEKTPAERAKEAPKNAPNYSEAELHDLLDLMEEILPCGPDEMQQVVQRHADKWPYGRNSVSIKRKYNQLHRRSIPTMRGREMHEKTTNSNF